MRRSEKYPNTKYFTYYNANPKNKNTSDCVIRALSTALNLPYAAVLTDLLHLQLKHGYDNGDPRLYSIYLKAKGWKKQAQPRNSDNTKFTGEEWCEFIQFFKSSSYQKMIAHIGTGHIVAIIDGKIMDTWDSSKGCIGNYWIAE